MQNLKSVVEALLPLIQADALEQGKYLVAHLEAVEDVTLNDNEIRQVILNLARNGLDAMARRGCLTVSTFTDGSDIVLAIQDQGCGIPPEIAEKIGTPFFTTKENGTGLGLGVCYDIVGRHNATIDYKTGKDGTTFYVRFKGEHTDKEL
ncbi:Sporulation kinase A [bioreactor metagenome]|uniref:Sporulation kinase A n=1 Tax=bioreactor metagenome TaxID=1076179 RepID=A0A645GBU1_9ZZZZ